MPDSAGKLPACWIFDMLAACLPRQTGSLSSVSEERAVPDLPFVVIRAR